MDINLVMNAINQIAAHDSGDRGQTHPLLFALSDYLHGALSALPDRSVRRQLELAGTHANLYAGVKRCSLTLRVARCPQATATIRRGVLSELSLCLMKNLQMKPGDRWKMSLAFEGAQDARGPIVLSMAFSTRRSGAFIDRQALLDALASSPDVMAGHVVVDPHVPPSRSRFTEAGFRFRVRPA